MRSREARVRVVEEGEWCRHCGHLGLTTAACSSGALQLWVAYCPMCGRVDQQASIPGSFGEDLGGTPIPPGPLH